MAIVLKAGILSLLEPSGPVQASNGVALNLPLQRLQLGDNVRHTTGVSSNHLLEKGLGLVIQPVLTLHQFGVK